MTARLTIERIGLEDEMTISDESFMIFWFGIGAASHLFWWWQMGAFREGIGWFMCLLSLFPAALLGILTFPFEAWLYWLTGPHSHERQKS